MMSEIKFTVEGFRYGSDRPHKRGVKIVTGPNVSRETYLASYREALDALYRHECEVVEALSDELPC
jgi:hypothetical protein